MIVALPAVAQIDFSVMLFKEMAMYFHSIVQTVLSYVNILQNAYVYICTKLKVE